MLYRHFYDAFRILLCTAVLPNKRKPEAEKTLENLLSECRRGKAVQQGRFETLRQKDRVTA